MIERRSAKIGRPEFSAPLQQREARKLVDPSFLHLYTSYSKERCKENARERLRTYKLNHLRNERQPLSPLGQDATM